MIEVQEVLSNFAPDFFILILTFFFNRRIRRNGNFVLVSQMHFGNP